MTRSFSLPDQASLGDLRTYLARAARVEDGSVRLIAGSGVLAVYTAILYPVGLLDDCPTVLGLRTFALTESVAFDVVVPIRSFRERLDRLAERLDAGADTKVTDTRRPDAAVTDAPVTDTPGEDDAIERVGAGLPVDAPIVAELPLEVHTVTWAAISPPRGGWAPLPSLEARRLRQAARDGIAEVAEAVPTSAGDAIVRKVRAEVWGRSIPGAEHVPAGAAFAGESLGFLADGEPVRLFETGPWSRLTTSRGHVLVKRRTSLLG